ncbi:MAG: saccharopine dehydrogenase NADP-binding domain-containing protein [Candidatus Bathyarchaeota archaeon]|nr:MAG: saccharopine dehydrogenase NADP-binding domain-containing protein [Candidatus Bathyarchaeota archaeon]
MKISVIGAGAQGSAIASVLSKNPEVSEIVSADINLKAAKLAVEKTKSDKVSAERVDAGNVEDLLRVVKGSDTVVNATSGFNLNMMDAALKSGANYVDLASMEGGTLEDSIQKQLAFNDKFKDAGLTAVMCMGGPYTTNVAVRYAADKLDRVDEIRLRAAWTGDESEEFIPTWAPMWSPVAALTEWIPPAAIYENGKWKEVPPFSGVEDYPFPEPMGPATVCYIDYDPTYTLPRFIKGVKYVDYKITPDRMAGALIKIGLGSDKPIDVKGVKVAPIDVLLTITPPATETFAAYEPEFLHSEKEFYGCSLAEVKGEKAGEKITRTVYRISGFRETYEKWGTVWAGVAVPAALTATMLAKREIKIKGVIPPEGLEPEPFLAKLAEKGWVYQERITREIRS